MPDLDASYDMIFFIGYHTGVGKLGGVMDHTYSGGRVHKFWINDKEMNESLINAAYAGYYNIPVTLIIGDNALYEELNKEDAMPWVNYVVTKEGLSKYAAKLRPINKIKEETIEAVQKALKSKETSKVYKFDLPTTVKIEFTKTSMADVVALMPYTKRVDGRTIDNFKVIFDAIMAMITLSYSAN